MTQALSTWEVGHFSLVVQGRYELVYLAVPMVILAFLFANHFNIVGMGKDFSRNLGVPYNLVLFGGLTIAAMITASMWWLWWGPSPTSASLCPTWWPCSRGTGSGAPWWTPPSLGPSSSWCCDVIARTVIAPYELPIELVVGILGSVIFIALLLYRFKPRPQGRRVWDRPTAEGAPPHHGPELEGGADAVNTAALVRRTNTRKLVILAVSGAAWLRWPT